MAGGVLFFVYAELLVFSAILIDAAKNKKLDGDFYEKVVKDFWFINFFWYCYLHFVFPFFGILCWKFDILEITRDIKALNSIGKAMRILEKGVDLKNQL